MTIYHRRRRVLLLVGAFGVAVILLQKELVWFQGSDRYKHPRS